MNSAVRLASAEALAALIIAIAGTTALSQAVELAPVDKAAIASGFSTGELTGRVVVDADLDPIGTIDDFIIAREHKAAFAVVDVGGYLEVGAHPVAVPVESLVLNDPSGKVMLPQATREALRKLPVYIPGE